MPENNLTTIQISKQSLALLRELAEHEKRSATKQAEWLIQQAHEIMFPSPTNGTTEMPA